MLKKLVGYAGLMFGANFLTGVFSFAVNTVGMATLPKDTFGEYALYMRIYEIGQGIFIYGANAAIQKYSAGNEENRLRFTSLALWLFFILIGVTSAVGVAVGFGISWNYALALFGLPWLVLSWWARYIVRSNLDAKREAVILMVASFTNCSMQAVFLAFTQHEGAMIYGDFLALIAAGIAGIFVLKSSLKVKLLPLLKLKIPRDMLKEAFRFAVPIWWSGQLFAVRLHFSSLWTNSKLGKPQLAAIQGSTLFWQFTQKPLEFLGQAALPAIVTAKEERPQLYREVLRLCLFAFTFIGIGVAAGTPLGIQIIDAALGRTGEDSLGVKYAEVPFLLRILALAMPLNAFQTVTNQLAVGTGKSRIVLVGNIVTVIILLATLWPLTEHYGLFGVIVAGAIGDAASAVVYAVMMYKDFKAEIRAGVTWTLLSVLCSSAALIPVYWTSDWAWNWTSFLPALVIFTALMLLFRVIHFQDFNRALNLFARKRKTS